MTAGQTDTFEDGSLAGWGVGGNSLVPPANISTGGPTGAGDHYMLMMATGGGGPGNRLTVFNTTQWTGNYTSAGISAISLDVNNQGSAPLALRLSFASSSGQVITANAVAVPAGSGRVAIMFPLDAAHLTALSGSISDTMSNVSEVRLYHNPLPGFAVPVVAQLGVDNVHAVPAASVGATVSGTVTLQGLAANAPNQIVTFTFRPTDGSSNVVRMASIGQGRAFAFTDIPAKSYILHIKADRYLAQNFVVNVANQNVTGLNADLPAGDATNDNTVDIGDFGVLVNAYNGDVNIPGSGYEVRADFNGDGIVDIGDFGLLVNSYNLSGAM